MDGSCKSEWTARGSYCYIVQPAVDGGVTWEDANEGCRLMDAELVSIHSKDENEFVETLAKTQSTDDFLWIGLVRNDEGLRHFPSDRLMLIDFYSTLSDLHQPA